MARLNNTDVQDALKFFSSSIQKVTSLPPVKGTPEGLVVLSDPSNPGSQGVYLYVNGYVIRMTNTGPTPVIPANTSGGGGITSAPVATGVYAYMKKGVSITGTQDVPQVLQTVVSPLDACDAPAGPYPVFDSTKLYSVILNGQIYQDCTFNVPVDIALAGTSLTFSVAASLASGATGTPKADIIIIAVPK